MIVGGFSDYRKLDKSDIDLYHAAIPQQTYKSCIMPIHVATKVVAGIVYKFQYKNGDEIEILKPLPKVEEDMKGNIILIQPKPILGEGQEKIIAQHCSGSLDEDLMVQPLNKWNSNIPRDLIQKS